MFNIKNLVKDNQLYQPYFEELSKGLYYSTGIGVKVLDQDMHLKYSYGRDTNILDTFPEMMQGFDQFIYKIRAKSINGVSPFTNQYGISFLVGLIADEHKIYGTILLGPVLLNPVNEQVISEILIKTDLGLTKRASIKSAYDKLTVINHARNYYLCQLLHNMLASNVCVSIDMMQMPSDMPQIKLEQIEPFVDMQNYNYELERLFISKVVSGDVESVRAIFNKEVKAHYFVNLGMDNLRPIKNNGIMFAAVLSRAAIRGGVDPNLALSLADQYVSRIEDIYRHSELIALVEQIAITFTDQVLQISEVNHASVVKKVSKYIHAHLSEQIRLNDVAEYVDLSPNYFSSLFKREMGIAFADYLNQIRIKESQFLLETTDYPIVDIAAATGFNNQNYFTTIFRKHTGTTPKQYRMKASIK